MSCEHEGCMVLIDVGDTQIHHCVPWRNYVLKGNRGTHGNRLPLELFQVPKEMTTRGSMNVRPHVRRVLRDRLRPKVDKWTARCVRVKEDEDG